MKYYSTQRPVMIGTFPDTDTVKEIHNFDSKRFCEDIGREAWGWIDYESPLTPEQEKAYEFVRGGMKTYTRVITTVDDRGTVHCHISGTVEAVRKPDNECKSTARRDIYVDYFEDYNEALQMVEDAKNA